MQLKHRGPLRGRVVTPARRENDYLTLIYLTKMINNVKIAKDSMNAKPSTSSV